MNESHLLQITRAIKHIIKISVISIIAILLMIIIIERSFADEPEISESTGQVYVYVLYTPKDIEKEGKGFNPEDYNISYIDQLGNIYFNNELITDHEAQLAFLKHCIVDYAFYGSED